MSSASVLIAGDNTISVIDISTNMVTATLRSRGFPEDVTVSTTARPRILKYSFHAFDPLGSVDTVALATNNHGQIVGFFADAAGTTHGFLRQPGGSFVFLDVPGSVFTQAAGINERGQVAGFYRLRGSPARHGFCATRIENEDD